METRVPGELSTVFDKPGSSNKQKELDPDKLYSKIGKLEIENDSLKKTCRSWENFDLRLLIERDSTLSIRMQCDFLGLPRSTYYHIPKSENKENLTIMQMMDKHIIEEPTTGVLTMQFMLKDRNLSVSYERVRRLMRKANVRTIYPRKHLTVLGEKKYIYPYLLNYLDINRSNQVWEIDITYIPMKQGFMY